MESKAPDLVSTLVAGSIAALLVAIYDRIATGEVDVMRVGLGFLLGAAVQTGVRATGVS